MAVVECKECGGQVSTKAASCPTCGAKAPKKTTAVTWFAVFAVGVVALNFVLRDEAPSKPAPPPLSAEQKAQRAAAAQSYAYVMAAERAVKASLKDPESAVFSDSVFRESGAVCGYVNARNSFGGFTGNKGYLVDTASGAILIEGSTKGFATVWNTRCR